MIQMRFLAILALLTACAAHAQEKPRLTFDVAVIRPSQPGIRDGGIKPLPGGFGYVAQNVSVKLMISLMYDVPGRQIQGAPEWLDTDRYDIEDKADRAYGRDDLHLLFQHLLEDRFHLKLHKDIKQGPVYALVVDSSNKMSVNNSPEDFHIPISYANPDVAAGTRVSMSYFAWWLGLQLQQDGRPVIDKTGLTGHYDFKLSFAPVRPPDQAPADRQDFPTLFEALKQQLGLKLLPQTGPITFLVIDHIERPSEN